MSMRLTRLEIPRNLSADRPGFRWRLFVGVPLGAPVLGLLLLGLSARPVGAAGAPPEPKTLEFIFGDVAYADGNQPPDPLSGTYWLKAIASQFGDDDHTVLISLQANLKDDPAAYIERVAFNLDPYSDLSALGDIRCAGDPKSTAAGICTGAASDKPKPAEWGFRFDKNQVDLPNRASGFDFEILLPNASNANRLTGSESFNFLIKGLKVSDLNHPNAGTDEGKPNALTNLFAAAKLNGYGGSATLLDPPDLSPPADAPGPLPILGAAAAFRAGRRLRRRLMPASARASRSA